MSLKTALYYSDAYFVVFAVSHSARVHKTNQGLTKLICVNYDWWSEQQGT